MQYTPTSDGGDQVMSVFRLMCLGIAGVAAVSCSAQRRGVEPVQVRYDFQLLVTRNPVIDRGLVGMFPGFGQFTAGTTGELSVLASESAVFQDPSITYWQIDNVFLRLATLDVAGDPSFYPSSNVGTALAVIDDVPTFGDLMQTRPVLADVPFFTQLLNLKDPPFPPGNDFGMIDVDGDTLPRSVDVNDPNVEATFNFFTPRPPGGPPLRVDVRVTDVAVTVIPAPLSGAALVPIALVACRRRR